MIGVIAKLTIKQGTNADFEATMNLIAEVGSGPEAPATVPGRSMYRW